MGCWGTDQKGISNSQYTEHHRTTKKKEEGNLCGGVLGRLKWGGRWGNIKKITTYKTAHLKRACKSLHEKVLMVGEPEHKKKSPFKQCLLGGVRIGSNNQGLIKVTPNNNVQKKE